VAWTCGVPVKKSRPTSRRPGRRVYRVALGPVLRYGWRDDSRGGNAMTSTETGRAWLPGLAGAPSAVLDHGRYRVAFATTEAELDEALHLRFRVFNLELGEGLDSSFATERDRDRFDDVCHHLLVRDRDDGRLIGTYRMQTAEMAADGMGFYADGEFQLDDLPVDVVGDSIEIGRACITQEHRNRQVLFLLWRGLAVYLTLFGKRYLFGCCSLTTQDAVTGMRLYAQLAERGMVRTDLGVAPRPGFACAASAAEIAAHRQVEVPTLFATYLRYGARVCGPPAIDRDFKTIDYLVLMDSAGLDPRTRRLFFD